MNGSPDLALAAEHERRAEAAESRYADESKAELAVSAAQGFERAADARFAAGEWRWAAATDRRAEAAWKAADCPEHALEARRRASIRDRNPQTPGDRAASAAGTAVASAIIARQSAEDYARQVRLDPAADARRYMPLRGEIVGLAHAARTAANEAERIADLPEADDRARKAAAVARSNADRAQQALEALPPRR